MKNPRTVIGALALSASALVGIAQWEDYRGEAYTPVKGDVGVNNASSTVQPRLILA